MPTPSVLCPVDFGPASLVAVEVAVEEAKLRGAALDLLHVWKPNVAVSSEGPPLSFEGEIPADEIENQLAALEVDLPKSRIRRHVTSGNPADNIVQSAIDLKSIMVVMGTHARHGLSRWIIGSVCDVVLRECPCPVLVCRGPDKAE